MPKYTLDLEVSQEVYDRLQRSDETVLRALNGSLSSQLNELVNSSDFRESIDDYDPEDLMDTTVKVDIGKLREIITAMGGELMTMGSNDKGTSVGAVMSVANMTAKNIAIVQKISNNEMSVAELISRYETGTLDYDAIKPENMVKVATDLTPDDLNQIMDTMKALGVDMVGMQNGAAFRASSIPEPYRKLIIDYMRGELTMGQVLAEFDKIRPNDFSDAERPTLLS